MFYILQIYEKVKEYVRFYLYFFLIKFNPLYLHY